MEFDRGQATPGSGSEEKAFLVLDSKGKQPKFGKLAEREKLHMVFHDDGADFSRVDASNMAFINSDNIWKEHHSEKNVRAAGAVSVEPQEFAVVQDGTPLDGTFSANLSPKNLLVLWGLTKYKYSGAGFLPKFWYLYEDLESELPLPEIGDSVQPPWYLNFDEAWKVAAMDDVDCKADMDKFDASLEGAKEKNLFDKVVGGYVGMFWG